MPKQFQYLRVAIKTEEARLLNWAHIVQLDEREDSLLIAQANKQQLLDILEEQRKLLNRFGRYDEKYKPLRRPLIEEASTQSRVNTINTIDEDNGSSTRLDDHSAGTLKRAGSTFQDRFPKSEKLLQKALQYVKSTQHSPAGLQWALFDKTATEELVNKLKSMKDYMEGFLTAGQMSELLQRQKRTEFQMIQLNNKVEQLLEIVQSGATFSSQSVRISANPFHAYLHGRGMLQSSTDHAEQSSQERLGALAKAKAFISVVDTNSLTDPLANDLSLGQSANEVMTVEVDRKNIKLIGKEEDETERVEASYFNGKRRQKVWIEWKSYDPQSFNGSPDPTIVERLRALTTLLKENKHTNNFRAPHCLGYFRDWDPNTNEDNCRFGLVTQKANFPPGDPARFFEINAKSNIPYRPLPRTL
jgi:hypothetical protein